MITAGESVRRGVVSREVGVRLLLDDSIGFGITYRALFDRTGLVALGEC